jgi:hypothetical protein
MLSTYIQSNPLGILIKTHNTNNESKTYQHDHSHFHLYIEKFLLHIILNTILIASISLYLIQKTMKGSRHYAQLQFVKVLGHLLAP